MNTQPVQEKIKALFSPLKVLIIGDVMIDSYVSGKADRLSPEAPVPVVEVKKRYSRMGGAANVALNITSLGATPLLCSVIGNEARGAEFGHLMQEAGLDCEGILRSDNRITTTKFRIIANQMQMLRVDEEMTTPLDENDESRLLQVVRYLIQSRNPHIILFQDYDKGVVTPRLIREVTRLAAEKGIGVSVDPKKRNFGAYQNVLLFKPNLKELKEGLGLKNEPDRPFDPAEAIARLQSENQARIVLVTLSEAGLAVRYRSSDNQYQYRHIPAQVRNITDVSGAGDTVISVASLCLAAGLDPAKTAAIANVAGGLVCEEVGVVPVVPERLAAELSKLNIDF